MTQYVCDNCGFTSGDESQVVKMTYGRDKHLCSQCNEEYAQKSTDLRNEIDEEYKKKAENLRIRMENLRKDFGV